MTPQFVSLVLLVLLFAAARSQPGSKDPDSEVVLTLSENKVAAGTILNVTCGLKSKNPDMLHERMVLAIPKEPIFAYRNIRARSKANWTCSVPYAAWTYMNAKACRTPVAILARVKVQARHRGNVTCTVKWSNILSRGSRRLTYSATKTVNLSVSWPPQVHYVFVQSSDPLKDVGPYTVRPGPTNISCGFVLGSDKSGKAKLTGLDSWKELDNPMNNQPWDLPIVHLLMTKNVTKADNGTRFSCSIGNHTKEQLLRVFYAPNITKMLPANGSSVTVGTNITCASDGYPKPYMGLRISSIPGPKKGIGAVSFMLPLDSYDGNYTVECFASNAVGITRKTWSIEVKQKQMKVQFSTARLQAAGTFLNLTCGTPDPEVQNIIVNIPPRGPWFEMKLNPKELTEISLQGRKAVKLLPYTSKRVTVLKVTNKQISVMVQLAKDHNGQEIECLVSAPGKVGNVKRRLLVTWPASVEEVWFENREGRGPLKRFTNTSVRCMIDFGNPAVPTDFVKARIGDRDLGKGYDGSYTSPRRSITWVTQVSQGENGLKATCSIRNNTKRGSKVLAEKSAVLDVRYSPSITEFLPGDGAAVLSRSLLNCSSDANPAALVVLSARQRSGPWREIGRGQGRAERSLRKLPGGRHFVKCEAWNRHGLAEQSHEILVLERPPKVELGLPNPLKSGTKQKISCSTEAQVPNLKELQLTVDALGVTFIRYPLGDRNTDSSDVYTRPTNKTSKKGSSERRKYTVGLVSLDTNRIDVSVEVLPKDHNKTVTCKSIGTDKGINATVEKRMSVALPSRLEKIFTCYPKSVKTLGKVVTNFTIITLFKQGIPPSKVQLEFTTGEMQEAPKLNGPIFLSQSTDKLGQSWLEQMWHFLTTDIDQPHKQIRAKVDPGPGVDDGLLVWLTWRKSRGSKVRKIHGIEMNCQILWQQYY